MKHAAHLAEALGLDRCPAGTISLAGGGGKTTAMFLLARELKAAGKKVLVTTTTTIGVPEMGQCDFELFDGSSTRELAAIPSATITCLGSGLLDGEIRKVKSIEPAYIDMLQQQGLFDCILVEADGAKRKPIKAPADYEPVIPASTTLVIGVVGLDALGKTVAEENIHRCDLFCACTGKKPGELIDSDSIIRLIAAEHGMFKGAPAASRKAVLFNKADTIELRKQGKKIAQELVRFQPRLHCVIASLQRGKFYAFRKNTFQAE